VFLENTFSMGYHMPKMEVVCKSYDPEKFKEVVFSSTVLQFQPILFIQ
jgi:hypothetical protein